MTVRATATVGMTCHGAGLLLSTKEAGEEVSYAGGEAARGRVLSGCWRRGQDDGWLGRLWLDWDGSGPGRRRWGRRRGQVRRHRRRCSGGGRRYGGRGGCGCTGCGSTGGAGCVADRREIAAVAEGHGDLRVHLAGAWGGGGGRQRRLGQAFADRQRKGGIGRRGGGATDRMGLDSPGGRRGRRTGSGGDGGHGDSH